MIRTLARRHGTAVAIVTTALLLLGAAPAHATDVEEHCIVLLDDDTVVCAATLEEADEAFTDATGFTRIGEEAGRGDVGVLAVYTLATLYPNAGYGGSGHTLTRTTDCNGVTVSGISDLSTVGFNNVVSSFRTYGTCQVRLYDGTGYSGSTYGYATSQTGLGAFNDLASSVHVR